MPYRMAHICHGCGVEAFEGQEFTEEGIPFLRARRYCPSCHRRFQEKLVLILYLGPLLWAAWGIYFSWRDGTHWSRFIGIRIALLFFFQWIMIFPHELGHALVARWLGWAIEMSASWLDRANQYRNSGSRVSIGSSILFRLVESPWPKQE